MLIGINAGSGTCFRIIRKFKAWLGTCKIQGLHSQSFLFDNRSVMLVIVVCYCSLLACLTLPNLVKQAIVSEKYGSTACNVGDIGGFALNILR